MKKLFKRHQLNLNNIIIFGNHKKGQNYIFFSLQTTAEVKKLNIANDIPRRCTGRANDFHRKNAKGRRLSAFYIKRAFE